MELSIFKKLYAIKISSKCLMSKVISLVSWYNHNKTVVLQNLIIKENINEQTTISRENLGISE